MMLKFGRIAVVSTAVLSLAAATIPSKAEAFGYFPGGPVGWGGGWGGGWNGCGCQVFVPPPPPPCCYAPPPPPCCVYGGGWGGGGWGPRGFNGGGYGVGFGGGYGGYGY